MTVLNTHQRAAKVDYMTDNDDTPNWENLSLFFGLK